MTYKPNKWYIKPLYEKLKEKGLLRKNESKKSTGYWQVTYDKESAGIGYMVVFTNNKEESLRVAKELCNGNNFRDPIEVEEQPTYDELYPEGVNGRSLTEF